MAKKKKVNPRNKPSSHADVNKAFQLGIETSLKLMCWTLREKMDMSDEWVADFNKKFRYQYELINDGYMSQQDLEQMMKEDYNMEVVFK